MSPKAFLLLETLANGAPRAFTKEELYDALWGSTVVEEVNLPNLVSEVRAALRDDRRNSRYVKTIHGYGYSFAAEVIRMSDDATALLRGERYTLHWRREEYQLRRGENILGRGEQCDVVIPSTAISRRHARIVVDGSGATIEDLQSKNGTYVDGVAVSVPTPLSDATQIRLGTIELTVHVVDTAASTATT